MRVRAQLYLSVVAMAGAAGRGSGQILAIRGTSDPPNQMFLNSLVGDAAYKSAAGGWFDTALPAFVTMAGAVVHVPIRVLIHVLLPAVILSPALDSGSPLFFPLPKPLGALLRKLIGKGLPSRFEDIRELRRDVLTYAALLDDADRTFDVGDVVVLPVAGTSLESVSPSLIRAGDSSNSMLAWLLVLLPGYYLGVASALMPSALALLLPVTALASDPVALVAVKVVTAFRESHFEPPFDYFVPFGAVVSELMRRRHSSEEARFAPLFAAHWRVIYTTLVSAFPAVTDPVIMQRSIQTLASACNFSFVLTPSAVDGVSIRVRALLPQLESDAPAASSSTEDRVAALAALYLRTARGSASIGRGGGSEAKEPGAEEERFDKLLADIDYKSLYAAVTALNTSAFIAADAALVVCRHKHPAGHIVLATTRSLPQSAWASVLGFRQKSSWQSMFDKVLAVDRHKVVRHDWGTLLPVTGDTPTFAIALVMGKLDKITDWWSMLRPWVVKYVGAHVLALPRYAATSDPADFWVSEDRLRLVEPALVAIFGAIGHGDSRSVTGSFREWLHFQVERCTQLGLLPSGTVAQAALLQDVKVAVSLTFSTFAEGVATMLLRPFHEAKRQAFCDVSSAAAKEFARVDSVIETTQVQMVLAEKGQAAHQMAQLHQVAPSTSYGSSVPTAPLSSVRDGSLSGGGSLTGSALGPSASVLAGSPAGPSAFPAGVFKDWGNAAVTLGVWQCPEGIAFGKFKISVRKPSVTFKQGTCRAGAAPSANARNRSKWCLDPVGCKAMGYAAHDRPEGTTNDDYVVAEYDEDTEDRSQWVVLVPPDYALARAAPPQPPWPLDSGPTGKWKWSGQKRDAPDDGGGASKGKGKGKKGKGSKGGRGDKANFERLSTGSKSVSFRCACLLARLRRWRVRGQCQAGRTPDRSASHAQREPP